jgi:hypothetical protein
VDTSRQFGKKILGKFLYKAICVNPTIEYCVVMDTATSSHYILASGLVDSFSKRVNKELEIKTRFTGNTHVTIKFNIKVKVYLEVNTNIRLWIVSHL